MRTDRMMHRMVPIRSLKASVSRALPEILEAGALACQRALLPCSNPSNVQSAAGDTTAWWGRATVCDAVVRAVDEQARACRRRHRELCIAGRARVGAYGRGVLALDETQSSAPVGCQNYVHTAGSSRFAGRTEC